MTTLAELAEKQGLKTVEEEPKVEVKEEPKKTPVKFKSMKK